jgi:hypothetical protein
MSQERSIEGSYMLHRYKFENVYVQIYKNENQKDYHDGKLEWKIKMIGKYFFIPSYLWYEYVMLAISHARKSLNLNARGREV